jgi:hypothetical protein
MAAGSQDGGWVWSTSYWSKQSDKVLTQAVWIQWLQYHRRLPRRIAYGVIRQNRFDLLTLLHCLDAAEHRYSLTVRKGLRKRRCEDSSPHHS